MSSASLKHFTLSLFLASSFLSASDSKAAIPSNEPKEAIGKSGKIENAPYRIDIPANWNGSLVMLMHGYEPVGMPRAETWPQTDFTPVYLAKGYAVAASAFSKQGWAVAEALPDTERLREHFSSVYGKPKKTFIYGFSLGGHLALATLETQDKNYDGALSICGVNVPASVIFDEGIVTPLVALEYFFPEALMLPKDGLLDASAPPMVDPELIEAAFVKNEANARILAERFEIPRAALAGAMMLNYMVLKEVQNRASGHPVDNTKTSYSGFGDDAAFNKGVKRYAGAPAAMDYIARNANLTGQINDHVVLLANQVDQTIPPRFTKHYPALVKDAGKSEQLLILPSVGEGHCNFTPEQVSGAFDALVERVEKHDKAKK
ncbi:MAG: alpha/beta hydrolase family protein [Arenimonas sp.]